METYKLQQVARKKETSAKTGKEYERVGIKINGEWYNGFGKQGVTDQWNTDVEVSGIVLYKEEYNGKEYNNWKLISPEERMTDLEKRVSKLEHGDKGLPWD